MTRALPLTLLAAALVTGGCAFERTTQVLTPGSPTTAATGGTSGAASTSLVGGWVSNTVTLPSPSSCGNFQYQIASQTATTIAGTFTATCGNGMVVSASANGSVSGNNVIVTINGSGSMTGIPSCTFSITGNGTVEDNGNTLRIPYAGTTCLGPVQGTEVLRRPQPNAQPAPAPAPAPEPAPAPAPAPAPSPSGPNDAINLSSVIITAGSPRDVANWPITTTITGIDFGSTGARVDFSKKDGPGRWPDVVPPGWDGPLQYTLWMVVNVNGQWYTSGGAEYWYGLDRQGGPPSQYAYNWYYNAQVWGPLANHQPANGERVGFFVTAGDARAKDVHIVAERSNVVAVPFPSGGGYFAFAGAIRTR
jgi:hypothetical protein